METNIIVIRHTRIHVKISKSTKPQIRFRLIFFVISDKFTGSRIQGGYEEESNIEQHKWFDVAYWDSGLDV